MTELEQTPVAVVDAANLQRAEELIAAITDQAARDRESFNAGYREAMAFCRAMFDHGVEVGYAQAINRITQAQGRLHAELVADTCTRQNAHNARAKPEVSMKCAEQGCPVYLPVHHRTRPIVVRCRTHRPYTTCPEHSEVDDCAYKTILEWTRRPEYMGGPVQWEDG